MPRFTDESTLSSSFSSMARELENLLSHTTHTSRFGVEGESIQSIDIVLYSKMEHNSTSGRGGASTYVISTGVRSGVISTGVITIHHIHVDDGNGDDRLALPCHVKG